MQKAHDEQKIKNLIKARISTCSLMHSKVFHLSGSLACRPTIKPSSQTVWPLQIIKAQFQIWHNFTIVLVHVCSQYCIPYPPLFHGIHYLVAVILRHIQGKIKALERPFFLYSYSLIFLLNFISLFSAFSYCC